MVVVGNKDNAEASCSRTRLQELRNQWCHSSADRVATLTCKTPVVQSQVGLFTDY